VDPETGNLITNASNLLPLKAQSLDVVGLITGDGSGLTNLVDAMSSSRLDELETRSNAWNSAVSDLGLLTSDLETHYVQKAGDTLSGNLTVQGNLNAGALRANTYKLPQTFVGGYDSLKKGELTAPSFAGWSNVFQGSAVDVVEYWDGTGWQSWTTDPNGVTTAHFAKLFDGDVTDGIKPDSSRYKWRVTFTQPASPSSVWFGGGVVAINQMWATGGAKAAEVTVEYYNDNAKWAGGYPPGRPVDTFVEVNRFFTLGAGSIGGTKTHSYGMSYDVGLVHTPMNRWRVTVDFGSALSNDQNVRNLRALSSALEKGTYLGYPMQVRNATDLEFKGTLKPQVSGQDLGTSSKRWNLFVDTLDVAGTLTGDGSGLTNLNAVTTETDPIWTAEKADYSTTAESDARYLNATDETVNISGNLSVQGQIIGDGSALYFTPRGDLSMGVHTNGLAH